jgi:[ribosomal protein S5]-alanine N-acetyltransferase
MTTIDQLGGPLHGLSQTCIHTERLVLIAGTPQLLQADLDGPETLASVLGVRVPPAGWPPGEWDTPAIRWMLAATEAPGSEPGWGAWYYVRSKDRMLVGAGGYKGPPDAAGTVEIGYSVVETEQRKGYATEAARGLVERAFADPRVTRVIAETYPHLDASLGVMRGLGMRPAETSSEEGVVRFELTR